MQENETTRVERREGVRDVSPHLVTCVKPVDKDHVEGFVVVSKVFILGHAILGCGLWIRIHRGFAMSHNSIIHIAFVAASDF
jgi:hypothetical protein